MNRLALSNLLRESDKELSPCIFIICMEILTNALIKESLKTKSGVGIKLCTKAKRIPRLLFADDCLIFCKADAPTCWRIKHILESFCDI